MVAQLQRETDQTKQDLVAQAAAVQELEELHLNRTVRVPPSGAVHRLFNTLRHTLTSR